MVECFVVNARPRGLDEVSFVQIFFYIAVFSSDEIIVTYYPDRPDVMATFKRVRIEADKSKFPVLLSNGNLLDEGDCDDGRHFAVWHGKKKPATLLV